MLIIIITIFLSYLRIYTSDNVQYKIIRDAMYNYIKRVSHLTNEQPIALISNLEPINLPIVCKECMSENTKEHLMKELHKFKEFLNTKNREFNLFTYPSAVYKLHINEYGYQVNELNRENYKLLFSEMLFNIKHNRESGLSNFLLEENVLGDIEILREIIKEVKNITDSVYSIIHSVLWCVKLQKRIITSKILQYRNKVLKRILKLNKKVHKGLNLPPNVISMINTKISKIEKTNVKIDNKISVLYTLKQKIRECKLLDNINLNALREIKLNVYGDGEDFEANKLLLMQNLLDVEVYKLYDQMDDTDRIKLVKKSVDNNIGDINYLYNSLKSYVDKEFIEIKGKLDLMFKFIKYEFTQKFGTKLKTVNLDTRKILVLYKTYSGLGELSDLLKQFV